MPEGRIGQHRVDICAQCAAAAAGVAHDDVHGREQQHGQRGDAEKKNPESLHAFFPIRANHGKLSGHTTAATTTTKK